MTALFPGDGETFYSLPQYGIMCNGAQLLYTNRYTAAATQALEEINAKSMKEDMNKLGAIQNSGVVRPNEFSETNKALMDANGHLRGDVMSSIMDMLVKQGKINDSGDTVGSAGATSEGSGYHKKHAKKYGGKTKKDKKKKRQFDFL